MFPKNLTQEEKFKAPSSLFLPMDVLETNILANISLKTEMKESLLSLLWGAYLFDSDICCKVFPKWM